MTRTTCPASKTCPIAPASACACINRKGLVFIGRRTDGPEHIDATHVWQMPQGGIDEGEDPYPAALRELHEETNIRSVEEARRDRGMADLRHSARDRRQGLEGQIPRPEAEMVRAALHRRGQRDRHRASRRRAQAGIRRMALGADGEPARAGRAVQAQGLRAGGEGIFEVREPAEKRSMLDISASVAAGHSAITRVFDVAMARPESILRSNRL